MDDLCPAMEADDGDAFLPSGFSAPAPGGGTPGRTPVLDGFAFPPEVFVRGARDVHVRLEPTEYAFFAGAPATEVVRAFSGELGLPVRAWHVRDQYFDTAAHTLFHNSVSVRVREYRHPPRDARFEVICVSWRGGDGGVDGTATPRTNRVVVQTFERIGGEPAQALVRQYARAGLRRVGSVEKTRTVFEAHPFVSEDAGGAPVRGTTGMRADHGDLRVTDHGLRVLVDEMHEAPFRGHAIVEVEFDLRRAAEAEAVLARIAPLMGPGTRPKDRNKIAYLLGAAAF